MRASETLLHGSNGSSVPAYEAMPHGRARSALVVLHDDFGLDEHSRESTRLLAVEGYHVVCPNLLHRMGGEVAPYGRTEDARAAPNAFSDADALVDLSTCLEYLTGAGPWTPDETGVLGYGIGGRYAFLAAVGLRVATCVSMCPSGLTAASTPPGSRSLTALAGELQVPWLGIFASSDERTPPEEIANLELALAAARLDVFTQVVRYERADGGFFSDRRATYSLEPAFDSWQRILEWFDRRVAPRSTPYHAAWLRQQKEIASLTSRAAG